MNKSECQRIAEMFYRLSNRGFTFTEAEILRQASLQLSRWCERCCNEDIETREDGKVYVTVHPDHGSPWAYPIRNMEAAAIRRINKLLANHPGWAWYYQTDPRGVSLRLYESNHEMLKQYPIESCYPSISFPIY